MAPFNPSNWVDSGLAPSGEKSTTRKSYREIQGVDVSSGFCCGAGNNPNFCNCCGDPCCGPKYVIHGLTLLPRGYRGDYSKLKEMLSEISTRSNEARFGRRDVV